ncbi:MAG: cyclic nucleotide-binding domain-containing protein [Actinobacteria bacterium]|nr:cyclic nucleotide-binding domain-containing protein [Actinomycetota bacterium]
MITQGDVGDAYYVVESGRLSVTVAGVVRNHTLVAGEGFGEIALLHDVPRTATIKSIEPCRLLRIERDDFLTAVTGNPDGHLIAHEVATAHLTRDADNAR